MGVVGGRRYRRTLGKFLLAVPTPNALSSMPGRHAVGCMVGYVQTPQEINMHEHGQARKSVNERRIDLTHDYLATGIGYSEERGSAYPPIRLHGHGQIPTPTGNRITNVLQF